VSAVPKVKAGHIPSQAARELLLHVRAYGLPEPVTEYQFHLERKWRFDIAFVEQKVALEIEGGLFRGGRGGGNAIGAHTSGVGVLRDMEKYNEAVVMGWRVVRVTPRQISDGTAVRLLWKLIAKQP